MHILYTGIGAKAGGIHTVEEFLTIMRRECIDHDWSQDPCTILFGLAGNVRLHYQDWALPRDFPQFTLADWLDYSGAVSVQD